MATFSKDFIVKNGLQVGGDTVRIGDIILKDMGDNTLNVYQSDGTTLAAVITPSNNVSYDNTASGLSATNVKAALDELKTSITNQDQAAEISYSNSTSGLTAATVQAAIDEIVADQDTNTKALLADLDGNIIPSADITYDLGSPTKQWRDLYIGPGSLYLNGTKVLEDDSGTLNFTADANQSMTLRTSGTGQTDITSVAGVNLSATGTGADVSLTADGNIEINSNLLILAGRAINTSDGNAVTFSVDADFGVNSINAATMTASGNVIVQGNLTVSGTTTTVNTETINLADNIITLNSNEAGTPSQNAGIEVERGTSTNKTFVWDEANDKWTVGSETMVAATFEGNLTGNVTGTVSTLSNHDTDDLAEGTNLYYTTARANSDFDTRLNTKDTDDLSEGTNLYYTDVRARAAISAGGDLSYNSTTGVVSFTERTDSEVQGLISVTDTGGFGSLSKSGGAITYTGISTEEIQDVVGAMVSSNSESGIAVTYDDTNGKLDFNVSDPTITLSGDVSGSATMTNLGNTTISVTIADDSHNHVVGNIDGLAEYIADTAGAMWSSNSESGVSVTYDDADNTLDINVNDPVITLAGAVTGSATMTDLGDVTITTTATSDPTLTLSGDASGSATFTNLGNATLSVTVANDSHNHSSSSGNFTVGGDLTVSGGDIVLSGTGRIQGVDTVSAGTDAANKTYVDTAISNLVNGADAAFDTLKEIQDAMATDTELSNAIAGLTNVATADSWTTARTISLSGDASGSVSIDGSANATLTVAVADNSHNHTTGNITGLSEYIQDISGAMWASNSESGVSVAYQDADGTLDINVNDPTITLTGAVTGSATMTNLGNVSIATTATADPTLTLSGDASGSATFTNLGNATLSVTVADDSHNHVISNIDGLQSALDGKQAAGNYFTDGDTVLNMANNDGFSYNDTTNVMYVKLDGTDYQLWHTGNDGSGSGLDADLLDGQHGSYYYSPANAPDPTLTINGDASGSATFTNLGNATLTLTIADDSHNHTIANVDGLQTALDGKLSTSSKAADSDLFDGLNSTQFLRSDTTDVQTSGAIRFNDNIELYIGSGNDVEHFWNGSHYYTDINGGANWYLRDGNSSNATRFTFDIDNGTFTCTDVNSTSDVNLKTNIETIESPREKVNALRGVNFDWIDSGQHTMGVVAQEVEEVIPEVVSTNEEGSKSVNYQAMVGLLIEAVKDLQAQVDELKNDK